MPWNAQASAGKLAPGIPKSDFWASDPNGINQVGCVYTAQGFEFDYVGVIFGPDLVYRPMDGGWVGQPKESHDRVVSRGVTTAEFTDRVPFAEEELLTLGRIRTARNDFVHGRSRTQPDPDDLDLGRVCESHSCLLGPLVTTCWSPSRRHRLTCVGS